MKITFLSYYSGLSNRGVETYVHNLSNELVNKGHVICVFQGGKPLSESLYETYKLDSSSDIPKIDKNTDVLIPTNGRLQSLKASIWTKVNKRKLVISGQSGLGIDDRINLYLFPDLFIGLTQFQSNWAKKINPFVKVTTIPNGVNVQKFSLNSKKMNFPLKGSRVLVVAALVKMKRIDLIIKAMAYLPEASLLIIGTGPEKTHLENLANELIPNRFIFTSAPHSDMPSIYASADVFVFATEKYESFGIAMVEALSLNKPVVYTPDPIRAEIVGNGGVMAKSDEPDDIAKAIKLALKYKWNREPRQRAEELSWSKIADRYIYELENL